jgi:UDP-N-acetylmuramate--alanine ligase
VVDLSSARRVHLVGVGGSGMSSIAIVLAEMGHKVTGTDAASSEVLDRLAGAGIEVRRGHHPELAEAAEMVAASSAVPADDPELCAARRRGVPVYRRAEMLGAICRLRKAAGVAGTHGKTSTSAMLAAAMDPLEPSILVGGEVAGLGSGGRWRERSEWIVVEADESDGTFLELPLQAAIVTSVEPDHLEFWKAEQQLREAFERFIEQVPGPVLACADDAGSAALAPLGARSYGTDRCADARIVGVEEERARSTFWIEYESKQEGPFEVAVPGMHNVRNAAGALVMAHLLGVPWEQAGEGLRRYRGVARRFELRGEAAGVSFVDDYAHLPGEVSATLEAARAGGWLRTVAVFQPHRYSRTSALWRGFSDCFTGADLLVVTDVYAAGEPPRPGVSGELIAQAVKEANPGADVRYAPTLRDVLELLKSELRPGDLCLTLGAGDLTHLPDRLIETLGAFGA